MDTNHEEQRFWGLNRNELLEKLVELHKLKDEKGGTMFGLSREQIHGILLKHYFTNEAPPAKT